jgi:hypothetical protein
MEFKQKNIDLFLLLLGLFGIATFLIVWLGDQELFKRLTDEDGIVENLSALFYLIGFFICLYRIFKKTSEKKIWLYLWCFLCFVFFGEEISWFQRILDYSAFPFMENLNAQGEVNIHNLNIFQGGHWMEALSSNKYGVKMFLSSQNIFRLCFILYFLIIPLLVHWGKLKLLKSKLNFPEPEIRFIITIWSVLAISFVLAGFSSELTKSSLAETREMFYALFILIYVVTHLRKARSVEPSE